MLNTRGPKQERRMLLMSVVKSQILYAAQIWAPAMDVDSYRRLISPTYRLCALRVCSAFRTVSEDAALVIAHRHYGIPKSVAKADARRLSLRKWQDRWDAAPNGRWTHRLIPNIEAWVGRKHGQVNFYLTQVLSGHGCFRQYLNRFGHDHFPTCPACPEGAFEDALHVAFSCARCSAERQRAERAIGQTLSVASLVPSMLERKDNWAAVSNYFGAIMRELRRLERERVGSA
ncbi:uncharacterized protein LOC124461611 [Drosophila willistoni]|uniref:uncharacterized protein LOC124461611 n=1 Tax=Drosophila willistoni TaxID=7260 RepID=UPI001F07B80D|nr:uncharacterized protein LOC124461611 [Drosophila willistoni]